MDEGEKNIEKLPPPDPSNNFPSPFELSSFKVPEILSSLVPSDISPQQNTEDEGQGQGPMGALDVHKLMESYAFTQNSPVSLPTRARSPLEGLDSGSSGFSSISELRGGSIAPLCASLRERLGRDPVGRVILSSRDLGIQMEPTFGEKSRLRRDFGLYPRDWEEPFGVEHLEGSRAQVVGIHMVGGGAQELSAGGLGKLISKMKRPTFSGKAEDWREFAREWGNWFDLVKEWTPGISDKAGLELLKDSLDPASNMLLVAMRDKDPSLTFVSFWRTLQTEFEKNLESHYRRQWEAVSLKGVSQISPYAWRNFVAEFRMALGRVDDVSEREIEKK